jgi:FkbM family methyltransferase
MTYARHRERVLPRDPGAPINRRIRVLHVISDAGPHPYFRLIGDHTDREAFDVRLATVGPAGALQRDAEQMNIPAIALGARSRAAYPLAVVALARYLRRERIDILQAHLLDGSVVGLLAARLARTPVAILTGHHSHEIPLHDNAALTGVDRLCGGPLCDAIIAPSAQMRDTFVDVHRVAAEKVVVVHHGFELDRIDRSRVDGNRVRAELGLEGRVVIGSIGRLFWMKNQDALVRAFAPIARRFPETVLLFVGPGDPVPLRDLGRSLGIDDQLRFLPVRDDIPDVLASLDLFVHPALAESFGMVIVEAMAMGVPVLSTPVGIAADVVRDGQTGMLAVDGRVESLARALEQMFELRGEWARMGATARLAAEAFPASAMIGEYERQYRRLLEESRPVRPRSAKDVVKAIRACPEVSSPIAIALRTVRRLAGRDWPWLVKHFPKSGIVRLGLPNGKQLKLWSRGDDWISTQLFWRGVAGYEPATVPVLYQLAALSHVTIDVGAYVGYLTVLAAMANPEGHVIALEPFPPTFERLRHNIGLNRLSNVDCVNAAAGAESGSAELYHLPGQLSSAASLERRHLMSCDGVTSTTVPVVVLDELLADRAVRRVDLIKLDTETTELQVLRGAAITLERDHPHIICEVLHPSLAEELTDLLKPLGYRFYDLRHAGPQERREIVAADEPDADYGNYLFSTLDPATVTSLHRW